MKFLVISRPNGSDHRQNKTTASAKSLSGSIRKLHENKTIEASYVFIGGGSAFVVVADSTKQLAVIVRSNPLFSSQNHEIIPIADAADFLEGYAEHVSSKKK